MSDEPDSVAVLKFKAAFAVFDTLTRGLAWLLALVAMFKGEWLPAIFFILYARVGSE